MMRIIITISPLMLFLVILTACTDPEIPPSPPSNLSVVAGDSQVELTWTIAIDTNIAYYSVYQSIENEEFDKYDNKIKINRATIDNLQNGTTYRYYVTSSNENDTESPKSNIVTARPTSYEYEVTVGWSLFEQSEYDEAKAAFLRATEIDNSAGEAHLGLGWSAVMLNQLSVAEYSFLQAILKDADRVDIETGLSGIYLDSQRFSDAVNCVNQVLQMNPSYQFQHISSIDYLDLLLVSIQSFIRMGEEYFESAQNLLDNIEPSNGLDPSAPNTWLVGDTTYDSYLEALLKYTEHLNAQHALCRSRDSDER